MSPIPEPESAQLHLDATHVADGKLAVTSLSPAVRSKVHGALTETLANELSKEGATLGLKPGDLVAISSSVGQSVSF